MDGVFNLTTVFTGNEANTICSMGHRRKVEEKREKSAEKIPKMDKSKTISASTV